MPRGKSVDISFVGKKIGRLIVLSYSGIKNGNSVWLCKCDCGVGKNIYRMALKSGNTTSCGCYHKERNISSKKTHGETKTKLYRVWQSMKRRCYNDKYHLSHAYKGRGITVCNEWKNNYISFRDWALLNGYKRGLSIDRVNVDGNYEPSNCRWTTMKVQQNNRTNNRLITYKGETLTLMQWSEKSGISDDNISQRLKAGWSVEEALTLAPSPLLKSKRI